MKYHLAEACQNSFILFDCLQSSSLDKFFLKKARVLLELEKRDDALILMQGASQGSCFYAHMAVLGLDGTLGEFCGNGARACAAYLFNTCPSYKELFLTTKRGTHRLTQHGRGIYSIHLPLPRFILNPTFIKETFFRENHHYVEVIEPHLVIPQQMNEEELFTLGRELNGRHDLFPRGINVNAYHVLKDGSLAIKTYERGVQRLTKACGTGSIACATWHQQTTLGTIRVINPGGIVEVTQLKEGIILKGEAFYV